MLSRHRFLTGVAIALFAFAASAVAVVLLADHSSIGIDPDHEKFAVEFTLAFAISLGWALGAAVEGWMRGDTPGDWIEAFCYRLLGGAVLVFTIIAAGAVALERLGVGPSNL